MTSKEERALKSSAICLIKPDGMAYGSEIKSYLQSCGVHLVTQFHCRLSAEDVSFLYPTLLSHPEAFERTCRSMQASEVEVILCEGEDIFVTLKMAKRYLRTLYAKVNPQGIIHTSEHAEEAAREQSYFLK